MKTTQLYDRCDAYYEYVCQLRFAAEGSTNLDKDYYAYAYAIYVDAEGNEVPVCSAVRVANYNDTYAAALALQ